MMYIVGTNHAIQRGGRGSTADEVAKFRELLVRIVADHNIQIAFEEMHEAEREVAFTVCEQVCNERETPIPVRFVDLSRGQRLDLAVDHWAEHALKSKLITNDMRSQKLDEAETLNSQLYSESVVAQSISKLSHGVRERIWLARMIKSNSWPALFICGANHVKSVSRLCEELHVGFQYVYNVNPDHEDQ